MKHRGQRALYTMRIVDEDDRSVEIPRSNRESAREH